jgi:hypothetical protein
MLKYILSLPFLILIFSCNTTKSVTTPVANTNTTTCQFEAVLIDVTNNSNCQFLFRLSNGTILLPSSMPRVDFPFFNNKKVILGYREFQSKNTRTKSDCGMEDKIVEITCLSEVIEEKGGPTTHDDCISIKNVYTSDWMPDTITILKPQKIFEYEYAIGFLYLFKKDETSHLYDCLGNKLCDSNDGGDCNSLIETLGKATLIQVLKN